MLRGGFSAAIAAALGLLFGLATCWWLPESQGERAFALPLLAA